MDDRFRPNKHSFKKSIESRNSNLSSCRSLERPSWNEGSKSLSKRHSFIEVMSLESGRKSDIYEKMLEEEKPLQRQSLGTFGEAIQHNAYDYPQAHDEAHFGLPTTFEQRKSEENHFSISHTCKCYKDCEWEVCSCLQAKNELCVQNYCCQECIRRKNLLLRNITVKIQEQEKVFCTCKKTKCNKKYCSCFAAGIMCGEKCSCEGCINCPRKSEHGMEVEEEEDPLTIEQLASMQMPEKMEFDPFVFHHHLG